MATVGEIFRRYGPTYRQKYGASIPLSHLKAMAAIETCRTEALGGHIFHCDTCDETHYRYHSCRNRHCPQCQNDAAQRWLESQQQLLLPVPYFMVTFTLPAGLRPVARSNQQLIYNLLFRTSAAALQELALDPRFVGGKIGMVGVLQTWTRDLQYHPHVHYIVPGGGLAADDQTWLSSRKNFLVRVEPLAKLFRAKFRAALQKTNLYSQVPTKTWSQEWVVDCRPVGNGQAALKYIAPYIFRVALSNNRILKVQDDQVTFVYKDGSTRKTHRCTLPVEEFMRRFLQHVLPKGFVKIRHYGLFSPGNRHRLQQAQRLLGLASAVNPTLAAVDSTVPAETPVADDSAPPQAFSCPHCGQPMRCIQTLQRRSRSPPRSVTSNLLLLA